MTSTRLAKLRDRLATSLWIAPTLAAALAVAGGYVLLRLERQLEYQGDTWFLFGGSSASARELMSTIASSMITFTALVFSITILVLQLASGQFSPRVLRTFLQDRTTKLALATFVGTFVYALALIPRIRGESEHVSRFVPELSVFGGFVLVLLSVGVFIHYLHHMANAIRAVTIIKHISADTRDQLEIMYPDTVLDSAPAPLPLPPGPPRAVIAHVERGGILSQVDEEGLVELACRSRLAIELIPMHGDFVPCGAPLFQVWGDATIDADELRRTVVIDIERTTGQDPLFGFRQLVDIAERALSTGINDPSTAVQVLDEIHDLLRLIATRQLPSPQRVDETGELRLILPRPDWTTFVRAGLDEIRHHGRGSLQVARRIRELIEDCRTVTTGARRSILDEELGLVDESIQRDIPSPTDRQIARRSSRLHGQA